MSPVYAHETETACNPEWVQMNALLSICTRALPASTSAQCNRDNIAADTAQRCNRKNCLFSAKRD